MGLCFGPTQHKFSTLKDNLHVCLNTNSPPFTKPMVQDEFRAISLKTKTKHHLNGKEVAASVDLLNVPFLPCAQACRGQRHGAKMTNLREGEMSSVDSTGPFLELQYRAWSH
jgi:hypothetical protein